jgi:hypothetical protein
MDTIKEETTTKPINKMDMRELRLFHNRHTGFIWQCKYCGNRYMDLLNAMDERERQKHL